MDCKTFQKKLPDLILTPGATPSPAAAAHLEACPPCTEELQSMRRTFALLDSWSAPDPSPYFEQKMQVRLREEIAAPRMGWFASLKARLLFNTGRQFRPAMAGALGFALLLGAGSEGYLHLTRGSGAQPEASATVNDLQILDRNAQAFEQLDQLQQDEDAPPPPSPQPATASQPAS